MLARDNGSEPNDVQITQACQIIRERHFAPHATYRGMKDPNSDRAKRLEYLLLAALAVAALAIRVLLYPIPGYKADMDIFVVWLAQAADGIPGFYARGFCDYPPLNVYLFWLFGSVAERLSLFGTDVVTYAVKIIPTIFDVATAVLIFAFVRARAGFKESLVSVAVYAFNPAVVFNSSVWGQFDSIYTFFLLTSFVLILRGRPMPACAVFTLAVLTKPQSVALAPLMAYLVYSRHGLRRTLESTLVIAATTLLVVLPINWGDPISFLFNIYFGGYSAYRFTSVNAFNLWGLFGMWKPDTVGFLFLTPFTAGWIMFAVATFVCIYMLDKHQEKHGDALVLFTAFLLLFSFFMLPTRIHERYIYPSLAFLTLLVPFWRRLKPIYGVLSVTLFINLVYALVTLNALTPIRDGDPIVLVVSATNTLVFAYSLSLLRKHDEVPEISSHAPLPLKASSP